MIDRQTIERIVDAADIVDVVSGFVTLTKDGDNYKGLCPFHEEKTPSFVVSPARGYCHCFTCGKGGNAVGFIMEKLHLGYQDALRWLAERYHIEVTEEDPAEEKRKMDERESLFILMEWAQGQFLSNFKETSEAGFLEFTWMCWYDHEDIDILGIGYAKPATDSLAQAALKAGFEERLLVDAGLCARLEDGTLVDRYRGCMTYPVRTTTGRVAAFIGMYLSDKGIIDAAVDAKESPIYQKGQEVCGIYHARQAMDKEDRCFIVRGLGDIAVMRHFGFKDVVATLGTRLTPKQALLLGRFTRNVTLAYGGDEAGVKAAMRDIDTLLANGFKVEVLSLPKGELPGGFLSKKAWEDALGYVDGSQVGFVEFKAGILLDGQDDPVKRSEGMNDILRSVSLIRDQEVRTAYIKECSRLFGLPEDTLTATVGRLIRTDIEATDKERARETDVEAIEYMLMEDIVFHGEATLFKEMKDGGFRNVTLAEYVDRSLEEYGMGLEDATHARMLEEVLRHLGDEGFTAKDYLVHHPDAGIRAVATKLAIAPGPVTMYRPFDAEALYNDVRRNIIALRKEYLQRKLWEVRGDIARAMAEGRDINDLRRRQDEIIAERRRLSAASGHIWGDKALARNDGEETEKPARSRRTSTNCCGECRPRRDT